MTLIVLNHDTETVHYHIVPDHFDEEDIDEFLYTTMDYSISGIQWMATNTITCESCKFWSSQYPAHCTKGIRGTPTEFIEFGCTLHQLKD